MCAAALEKDSRALLHLSSAGEGIFNFLRYMSVAVFKRPADSNNQRIAKLGLDPTSGSFSSYACTLSSSCRIWHSVVVWICRLFPFQVVGVRGELAGF